MNYCPKCGYKITNPDFIYCPKCGSKLSEISHKKTFNKDKSNAEDKQTNKSAKSLDIKVIYGLVSGGVIFIFLVLYVSGVFDTAKIPSANTMNLNNQQPQIQQPGINLSAIQKINELEAIVKANPNDHQSLLELAHLRMDSGFYEQAIQNYKTYLNIILMMQM